MARAECGHGHFYDSDIYPSCPYCNNGRNMWVDLNNDPGKTMPIDMGTQNNVQSAGAYNPTVGPMGGAPVYATDPGVTLPPGIYRSVTDGQKTVAMAKKKISDAAAMPVAGWLVCIKGPQKGRDYRIESKINTVGRSESMDICIKGDNTISKENHMRIAYEDKHNTFTVIPAENTNVIYVNDSPIYVPTMLSPYDKIELGETLLLFVPLCGDSFRWTDTVESKE